MKRSVYDEQGIIVNIYDKQREITTGPLKTELSLSKAVEIRKGWQPAVQLISNSSDSMRSDKFTEEARESDGWVLFEAPERSSPLSPQIAEALYLRVLDFGYEEESILRVARTFGMLGSGMFLGYLDGSLQIKDDPEEDAVVAESLEEWRYWLTEFHTTELARQAMFAQDISTCKRLIDQIRVAEEAVYRRLSGFRAEMTAMHLFGLRMMTKDANRLNDWRAIGRDRFEASVSHTLNGFCDVKLSMSPKPTLVIQGDGLIASVIASFALSVLPGSGTARRCLGCGEWFLARHGKTRHCSDSCKTQAYRKRKAQAGDKNIGE